MITWNGKQKQLVRDAVFVGSMNYSRSLWLTGYELRDVILARKRNFIAKDGAAIVIERDLETSNAIREEWAKHPELPKVKVIHGELEKQNIAALGELDFVQLDFCGTLSKSLSLAMSCLNIADGGSIFVNLCHAKRPSFFMGDAEHYFLTEQKNQLDQMLGAMKTNDVGLAVQVCLLFSIFRNYEFKFSRPIFYKDNKNAMTTYCFTNMRRLRVPKFPNFLSFSSESNMKKSLTFAQVRHNAAKKAWETRRANAAVTSHAKPQNTSQIVINALLEAKTPGKKAAATKMLNAYVQKREKDGKDPKMVRAGIMACISRINNKA